MDQFLIGFFDGITYAILGVIAICVYSVVYLTGATLYDEFKKYLKGL